MSTYHKCSDCRKYTEGNGPVDSFCQCDKPLVPAHKCYVCREPTAGQWVFCQHKNPVEDPSNNA